MPWKIIGPPWYVVNKHTGRKMSKQPHSSKAAARRQLNALYAHAKPGEVIK